MFKNYKSNVLSFIFRMDKFLLFMSLFILSVDFITQVFFMSKGTDLFKSLSISLATFIVVLSGVYSILSLTYSSKIAMNLSVNKSVFGRHFIAYNFLVGVIFSLLLIGFVTLFIKLSLINLVMLFVFLLASISFYSSLFLAVISTSTLFTLNFGKVSTIISQISTILICFLLSGGVAIIISKTNVLLNILKSAFIGDFYIVVIFLLALNFLFRIIFIKNYSKTGFEMIGVEIKY